MARRAPGITFSRLRGELIELPGGIVLVNDCYNANPVSMRAALDHLVIDEGARATSRSSARWRSSDPDAAGYHREAGAHARRLGVGPILGVGELARDYAPDDWAPDVEAAAPLAEALIEPGDAALIKGSRSVGLELIADRLRPPTADRR